MPKVRDLRLIDELPARIAEPLMWFENIFKHGQPAYLLALLTGLSVCHHAKTRFSISPTHWFSVPLNLYSGIVGQVSTGKTPLVDTVVRKPLHALEKLEPDPKAHHARRYFFQNATNAWLRDQFLTLPNQSLLYFRDGGLPRILIPPRFGYSQSPSAIHPDLLLGYDGEEVLETGKGDYTPQYSVLATGVTRFVSEHMNKDKYSPIWTRFLWAQLSYPGARYLSDDKPKYSVHETIVEFYRRAASLPAVNYVLTHKSGKLFCDACNKLQNEMVLSPDIGMRTAFDYAPGNLARLIGNCHIIHELAEGKDVPTSEISLSRVQQGVRLIYLFLEQLKQIYSY